MTLFCEVRDSIGLEVKRIQKLLRLLQTGCISPLAQVAHRNNYVCPQMNEQGLINIKNGRHPVVEMTITNDMFELNDTLFDNESNRVSIIICNSNMAGKSTYMRQTALIVLMAQIGSFVPADSAQIAIVDRIFTQSRCIGDDLLSGQSTFMVEMTEVANILRNATKIVCLY